MKKVTKKFSHPLMSDNITKEDVANLISFIKKLIDLQMDLELENLKKNGLNG